MSLSSFTGAPIDYKMVLTGDFLFTYIYSSFCHDEGDIMILNLFLLFSFAYK